MFAALLVGAQFVLSGVAGVEIVTPLLLSFCLFFGPLPGVFVSTAFTFARCLFFGFHPPAVILYLVYYNLFAVLFGLLGRRLGNKPRVPAYVLLTVLAVVCTALFTLLDDLITPLFYGFTGKQMYAYFLASFAIMVPQCICTALTVPCLLPPLLTVYHYLPLAEHRRK